MVKNQKIHNKKLLGEFKHSIDSKRRFFIPAELRVSSSWVITAGLDNCLFLFPEEEWVSVTDRIMKLPMTKKDSRAFLRIMLSKAKSVMLDKMGRLLVPENLAEFSGLRNSCIIIGMLNRVEIWDPGEWEEYSSAAQSDYSEIAERISELEL